MNQNSSVVSASVAVVLLAATAALAACSHASDTSSSNESSIQNGVADPGNTFAVGVYNRGASSICSGALIAPNLVLTARHCVAPSPQSIRCDLNQQFGTNYPASAFTVTTAGTLVMGGPGNYTAAEIVTSAESGVCGNDIALIVLTKNVPRTEATPIPPAVTTPISDHTVYGKAVTAIGYGITGPNHGDSGKRRIKMDIPIRCIPGDPSLPCRGVVTSSVNPKEFVTAPGTCSGDSGSSAYDQDSFNARRPVSLGVLSRGTDDATNCLDATYTRNDSFSDMIITTALAAARRGNYRAAPWATGPEPVVVPVEVPVPAVVDAGAAPEDAGASEDAGRAVDAGETDAAVALDAGADAGPREAGAAADADRPDAGGLGDAWWLDPVIMAFPDKDAPIDRGKPRDAGTKNLAPAGDGGNAGTFSVPEPSAPAEPAPTAAAESGGCSVPGGASGGLRLRGLGAFAALASLALFRRRRVTKA